MAILIGLSIAFALGGIAYLGYEDEIEEARQLARENGIDPDDVDLSDFAQSEDSESSAELLENDLLPSETSLEPVAIAEPVFQAEPLVAFEPDNEQIVVELDADLDVDAPAQNVFDPETNSTTLSIGDSTVVSLLGDQTDVSVGFGTQAETENGLSPFDIVLVQNRLDPV